MNDKVNEREKQIMFLLSEDPGYTVTQLSIKTNKSRKSIASYLKSMKEKGIIERVGSDRKGYWKIIK